MSFTKLTIDIIGTVIVIAFTFTVLLRGPERVAHDFGVLAGQVVHGAQEGYTNVK